MFELGEKKTISENKISAFHIYFYYLLGITVKKKKILNDHPRLKY